MLPVVSAVACTIRSAVACSMRMPFDKARGRWCVVTG